MSREIASLHEAREITRHYFRGTEVPGTVTFQNMGSLVLHSVLDSWTVHALRAICAPRCVGAMTPDSEAMTLPVYCEEPAFLELIKHGAELLDALQFPDVRYASGAIIPKYAHEGRRAWHVDWWAPEKPEAKQSLSPQVGLIFYLDSTMNPDFYNEHEAHWSTGALAVMPVITPYSRMTTTFSHSAAAKQFMHRQRRYSSEQQRPVSAGSAVLIDSRLMHATTENLVPQTRIAITLWYMINWTKLDRDIKRTTMLSVTPAMPSLLGSLCPDHDYSGEILVHKKIPV